jgi:hypothetical protein
MAAAAWHVSYGSSCVPHQLDIAACCAYGSCCMPHQRGARHVSFSSQNIALHAFFYMKIVLCLKNSYKRAAEREPTQKPQWQTS